MPDYSAAQIVEMCEKHKNRTTDLRTRWEDEFDLVRQESYQPPKDKGELESITCNTPAVLAGKVIEYLSDGQWKFHVPIQAKENKKARAKGNENELFVYAMHELAEDRWQSFPEHCALQSETAFYVTVYGWIVRRVYLWEDAGEVIPDVAVWDPHNTFWGTGGKGLDWACYTRYASLAEVKDLYSKAENVKEDAKGRIIIYDWWNNEVEKVVIGTDIVYENKHNLGYVPVYIKPCGATPLIQGGRHDDTIKNVGEGIDYYDRPIFPVQNEMASYYFNCVKLGVNTPQVLWVKGTVPKDNPFDANPYKKGSVIRLSTEHYEKLEEFIKPTMPQDAAGFMNIVMGMINQGGLSPILSGNLEQQQTAQGINILNHNAMTILKPRKKAMELCENWASREFIHQYINGKFGKMELSGIDQRQKQYAITVSPDKLEKTRRVISELMLNLPQDEFQNAGIMTTLVQAGIISRQTARDKFANIQDTDAEETLIDMEKIKVIPQIWLPVVAAALIKDGRIDEAKSVIRYMESQGLSGEQPNPQATPNIPTAPKPVTPAAGVKGQMAGATMNVPKEIQERARLNAMGLVRG